MIDKSTLFWNSFVALTLLIYCSFSVTAQVTEFPYTEISLKDLKEFKHTGKNWKIAGDIFYDIKEAGKGKSSPGTGIIVNDLSDKNNQHLFTNIEHGDI